MRFGLVGTSMWAEKVHAEGIRRAGAELVGVWGRSPEKASALASACGARALESYDELLDAVDAVAFAVPPYVQAPMAVQAARAGKHLLLDKPLALDPEEARAVEHAVAEAGVASVVFLTACFTPERRAFVATLPSGPLEGGSVLFLASAFAPGSPFDTPWRREKGALWDIGPHALAALTDALGPVRRVLSAAGGAGDLVHLVLEHDSGATSTATLTLAADPAIGRAEVRVWGDATFLELPRSQEEVQDTHARAVSELVAAAASGERHAYDVSYGRRQVELLAEAEALLG